MEETNLISHPEKRKSDKAELIETSKPILKKICKNSDKEIRSVAEIDDLPKPAVPEFQSVIDSSDIALLDSDKKLNEPCEKLSLCSLDNKDINNSNLEATESASSNNDLKINVDEKVESLTTDPVPAFCSDSFSNSDYISEINIGSSLPKKKNNSDEATGSVRTEKLSISKEPAGDIINEKALQKPLDVFPKEVGLDVFINNFEVPEVLDIVDTTSRASTVVKIVSEISINLNKMKETPCSLIENVNVLDQADNITPLDDSKDLGTPLHSEKDDIQKINKCVPILNSTEIPIIGDSVGAAAIPIRGNYTIAAEAVLNIQDSIDDEAVPAIRDVIGVDTTPVMEDFGRTEVTSIPDYTSCADPIVPDSNNTNNTAHKDANFILKDGMDTSPILDDTAIIGESNDSPVINNAHDIVSIPCDTVMSVLDNSKICDIKNRNLVSSESAQSPTNVISKESIEHEISDVKSSKIPSMAESLKEAVSTNVPCSEDSSNLVSMNGREMLDVIKKDEPSPMEVDTPSESLIDTPYESGETTPSTSTPADSCQVSAAPSPLTKEDLGTGLPYNEDESSKDTKLHDEIIDMKEETNELPSKGRSRKSISKTKKALAKLSKQKGPILLDEETRMSANGNDKPSLEELPPDEDSQSSVSTSLTSSKKKVRSFRSEVIVPESTEVFTADKVIEYIWPMDGNGEHFFIQEHMAQYLGITSFKRKYRDLRRRPIESTEKEYLKDMGLVSEMACDLGLTAVRSEDMLDILFNDFPTKYEELQKLWRERDEKQLKEKGKVDYQVANLDKSKMQEYSRKAALNASKWNAAFMREKREERRYSFDLQTFTVHYPLKSHKSFEEPTVGSYPIAVLPGQYTDYYRRYSANELKAMPLQTVLNGPYTTEELAAEVLGTESDEESAPASVCTSIGLDVKEEISQAELEPALPAVPVSIDPLSAEKQPRCKVCNGGRDRNKDGKPEPLIICGTCRIASHPTCIDLPLTMIEKIEMYSWQCMECKTCAQCNDPDDEEKMIFCDMCDRGYHIYCVGLRKVPNGRWHCKECAICSSCGSKTPSGNEHIKNAEWQHEFKKDKDKQLKYICTLCVPCDKYWKRRQYCTVCLKVYRSIPDDGMVRCAGCPKYIHKDGCSLMVDNERHCTICYSSRNKTALNHSRIIAAAKKKMASSY